jgi:hypothetical protein
MTPPHHPRKSATLLVMALCVGGGLGVAGIVAGGLKTSRSDDLWLEIAKSGVQLLVVGVLSGGLAATWRYFESQHEARERQSERDRENRLRQTEHERDQRQRQSEFDRDREQERNDRRLAVFAQIVSSYNDVKAIRRELRSFGFRRVEGELDAEQVTEFRRLMSQLNRTQLAFEGMKRELGETDLFGEDTAAVATALFNIEDYLNGTLKLWENDGRDVRVGLSAAVVSSGLDGLIGPAQKFKRGVVAPRDVATQLIHKHLFGPATSATTSQLQSLEVPEQEQ